MATTGFHRLNRFRLKRCHDLLVNDPQDLRFMTLIIEWPLGQCPDLLLGSTIFWRVCGSSEDLPFVFLARSRTNYYVEQCGEWPILAPQIIGFSTYECPSISTTIDDYCLLFCFSKLLPKRRTVRSCKVIYASREDGRPFSFP